MACDAVPQETLRIRLLSAYPMRSSVGSVMRSTEDIDVRNSQIGRIYTLGTMVIFGLSSATMLWLLWRFPMGTALGSLAVLLLFGIVAHLSRSSDTDIVSGFQSRPTA